MPEGVERQGIGTPATRAATIEKLVQKGFLERKGSKKTRVLLPTDKGKALITVMPEEMNEKVMVSPEIQSEAVVLPQIVSIKQASQRMGLPEYYIRRLCREVPGMAFQSGIKWYINLGKMADYFNGGTTTS